MKLVVTITLFILSLKNACTQNLSNITGTVNEDNVFIPCPFEFQSTLLIWKINGKEYTSATLPSFFSQHPGGLFIKTVHRCFDGYTFQCIDTSSDGLVGQSSRIIMLIVIPRNSVPCPVDLVVFKNTSLKNRETIELDHKRLDFENGNITLVWKIFSKHTDRNSSWIVSCPPCQPNDIQFNSVTNKASITIPSEAVRVSGPGVPSSVISIKSLSDCPMTQCPKLPETIQFDVNETESVQLLLGNNNCTCLEIACSGGLTVVVTSPNSTLMDIICPAYVDGDGTCFSIADCAKFAHNAYYHPFFRICENNLDRSRCSVCFENITSEVNGVKLFFYTLWNIGVDCGSQEPPTRLYFRSFLLNTLASPEIVFNNTSGEICFTSSSHVTASNLYLYNISITDITKNLIIERNSVPEPYCVIIDKPHIQCGPFLVSAYLYSVNNNSLVYGSVSQQIILGNGNLCSCLKENVQFQVSASDFDSINYTCSSIYLSQIEVTITIEKNQKRGSRVACIEENTSVSFNGSCGSRVDVCGFWTFTNGSVLEDCPLNCTSLLGPMCPTTFLIVPSPQVDIVVIATVIATVVFIALLVVCIIVCVVCVCCCRKKSPTWALNLGTDSAFHDMPSVTDHKAPVKLFDAGNEDVDKGGDNNDKD